MGIGGTLPSGEVVAGGEVSIVVGLGLVDVETGAVSSPLSVHAATGPIARADIVSTTERRRVVMRFT